MLFRSVIVCPITSGDTAFRSARLVLADWFKVDQSKFTKRLILCVPLLAVGAVLPILHLNGYKISNPTVLARISHEELEHFFDGCGWKPYFVEGSDPMEMHRKMAEALDTVMDEIKAIQKDARENNNTERPKWPMIVLSTDRKSVV